MSSRLTLPLVLAVLGVGACDNLGIGGAPDELTVDVESIAGSSQILLVTSTKWIYEPDPTCDPSQPGGCPQTVKVLTADTATVSSPYRTTFRFDSDYRYLVEASPADGAAATLKMKVEIDGKEWFNEARDLDPSGEGSLQFLYQWREPTLR
jgi:hypothetical protein